MPARSSAMFHQRTEDGFETTFAVNHLAHYLLLRLLMPRLVSGAIVVTTTSNLHDPKTNQIAPPEHADGEKLARGQIELSNNSPGSRSAIRAYATSKLCNLLTARALASSAFAQERGLRVIAFNPGLTPGTQLTRNHPLAFRLFLCSDSADSEPIPAHEHSRRWRRPSGKSDARPGRASGGAALCLAGQASPDVARSLRTSERRCRDGETLARQRGFGWSARSTMKNACPSSSCAGQS